MTNQNQSGVTFPKCRNCGVRADDKYDSKELIEDAIIGDIEWYCDKFCASEGDVMGEPKSYPQYWQIYSPENDGIVSVVSVTGVSPKEKNELIQVVPRDEYNKLAEENQHLQMRLEAKERESKGVERQIEMTGESLVKARDAHLSDLEKNDKLRKENQRLNKLLQVIELKSRISLFESIFELGDSHLPWSKSRYAFEVKRLKEISNSSEAPSGSTGNQ